MSRPTAAVLLTGSELLDGRTRDRNGHYLGGTLSRRGFRVSHIVISPGPGVPANAGISEAVIECLGNHIPVLGVCLGHQAIGDVFGGHVVRAPRLMHGKTSPIYHDGKGVFAGLPNPF